MELKDYSEVRNDYVSDETVYYIDAWKEGVEQGVTAAVVINGIVYYSSRLAINSSRVHEAARDIIAEHFKWAQKH